jgi:hypothetical protein
MAVHERELEGAFKGFSNRESVCGLAAATVATPAIGPSMPEASWWRAQGMLVAIACFTMVRNMLRRGIRALQNGADPQHMSRQEGQVITTYSQDRVIVGIPPAPTPEEDRRLLQEMGRKVVEDCQQRAQTS